LPGSARLRWFLVAVLARRVPKRTRFRARREAPPEVWFRILHIAPDRHNGLPVVEFYEQTVEIALDFKGAFESGGREASEERGYLRASTCLR